MATTTPRTQRSPRVQHETQVLDLLRVRGSASRAEIVAATGLSRATVSAITVNLRRSGLVVRSDEVVTTSGVGRTPEQLTLNPGSRVIVGVEFSHTRVTVVVSDVTHRVLGSRIQEHPHDEPWDRRLATAIGFVESLVTAPSTLIAIGMGVPGSIAGRAAVVTRVERRLADRFGVPIRVENNARLAGLAEFSWGAGRDMPDLVYIRLSVGIGGLLIVAGEPHLGNTGSAGELGHVCVNPNGPVCRCGGRGCLEAYAGVRTVLALARVGSVEHLAAALDRAEPQAQAAITDTGTCIGLVLANTCRILDISSVVLGGPLADVGDHLVSVVRQTIVRHTHSGSAGSLKIRTARLGNLDGALGGIALVLRDRTIPVGPRPASITTRKDKAATS